METVTAAANHEASGVDALRAKLARAPRLLFVAYAFPPASLPGCARTSSIARQTVRLGWDVTVVTVDAAQWMLREDASSIPPATRIDAPVRWPILAVPQVRPPAAIPSLAGRVVRKLASIARIDPEIGWTRGAAEATESLRPGSADVVLVSAPPFSSVLFASRLAERLACPYVVDYRDLWTLNPVVSRQPPRRDVRSERRFTAGATALTVIGPSSATLLEKAFDVSGKVHVIPNGYDRDVLGDVVPARFDSFAIVYAGTFYFQRRIDPVVRALADIERRQAIASDWRFHYYGPQGEHVRSAAAAAGLPAHRLVDHGRVSKAEALSAVAGADLVSVVTTSSPEPTVGDRGIVTGKIFEAIGLRKQMLVVGPRGSDVERVIATTGLGRVIPATEPEEIARYIADRARGATVPARQPEAYEWTSIGPRLSSVLSCAVLTNQH